MKGCILKRKNLWEEIDDAAGKLEISRQIVEIKSRLESGLTLEQRDLLRQLDDAFVTESTKTVIAALTMTCGCPECRE